MCTMDVEEIEVCSCVRGYHVYQALWIPLIGEELVCVREPRNAADRYDVAVKKCGQTIGHLPRKISKLCCLLLRRGGTISAKIASNRRYSADLPQGGMEITCILTFKGKAKLIKNIRKYIKQN